MSTAVAAATVVVLRETAAGPPEILLTERGRTLGFGGGAMVFPGGKVDPADLGIARDPALATGFDTLTDTDAAARIAAAREAFEEVGILLSAGPALPAATIADWRARFAAVPDVQEPATYAAFLAATGHRADAARLTPFAHWVPPENAAITRRFDTLFYVTVVPPETVVAADGHEAVAAYWTTAAAAVDRAEAGGIELIFPTRRSLERLAQYGSIAALLARLEQPPTRIQPEIQLRDGVPWLTIPQGCDYPVTAERLDTSRRH